MILVARRPRRWPPGLLAAKTSRPPQGTPGASALPVHVALTLIALGPIARPITNIVRAFTPHALFCWFLGLVSVAPLVPKDSSTVNSMLIFALPLRNELMDGPENISVFPKLRTRAYRLLRSGNTAVMEAPSHSRRLDSLQADSNESHCHAAAPTWCHRSRD